MFYIGKDKIITAWAESGVVIDYADRLAEEAKRAIVHAAIAKIDDDPDLLARIAAATLGKIGAAEIKAFENRVAGRIGATPQQYRIFVIDHQAHSFGTRADVDQFIDGSEPVTDEREAVRAYAYEVIFGDGDLFTRDGLDWLGVRELHSQLDRLVEHMQGVARADS